MGLVLHVEPGRCWTELTLEQRFEGWDGIAHGGILCTILDEVMAWSLVGEDNWGLTARISVEFKKPVEVGEPIRAEGWITRSRRRLVDTAARIIDAATGEELRHRDRRLRRRRRGAQAGASRSATATAARPSGRPRGRRPR